VGKSQVWVPAEARIKPMLGFQSFQTTATTTASVDLMHCIRKGQFTLEVLGIYGKTAPDIWNAVLAS
jgi:transposase-like protein